MSTVQSILIVDDRARNLFVLEKTLSILGVAVVKAQSGNEALAATLNHDFALAIVDVQMPEMDGLELAGLMRGDERTQHVPIIFLTAAYGAEDKVFEGYRAGAVDYIVKPYNEAVLLAKAEVFLAIDRLRRELADEKRHQEDLVERRTKELAESEARYRALVESSPDGIILTDLQGTLLMCNQRAASLHGYEHSDEMRGMGAIELIAPEDRERAGHNARRTLEEGRLTSVEYTLLRKDGSRFSSELNAALIRDAEGAPVGFIGTTRDITERKRAERALRASEEFSRRVLQSSNDCIKTVDLEGRLLSMSERGREQFEIDDIAPYLQQSWVELWKGKDRDAAWEAMAQALAGGVGRFVGYCPTAKGTPRWWEVVVTPIKGEADGIEAFLAVSSDITERRRSEEDLRRYREHLEELVADRTRQLAASEARYRTLFNQANDAILVYEFPDAGPAGTFLEVNDVACERLGYSREQLLSMSLGDIISPEQTALVPSLFARLRQGDAIVAESTHKTRDGRLIPVEVNSHLFVADEKTLVLSVARDITARKQAEAALAEEHEFSELLLRSIPFSMAIVDERCQLLFLNDRLEALIGKGAVGKPCYAALRDEGTQCEQCPLRDGLSPTTRVAQDAGGMLGGRVLRISRTPMTYKGKSALLEVFEDITDHIEAERRYQTVIQTALDGFWIIDHQGRLVDANDAACAMTGYTREQLLGMPVTALATNESPEEVERRGRRVKELGSDRFEGRIRRRDGTEIDIEVSMQSAAFRGGAVVLFMKDITDRKRADEELRLAKQTAEDANRAKSVFLANMSHEIRTPMNAILGFAQLLRHDRTLTEQQNLQVNTIMRGGEHLLALITEVLEYSKIESGRLTVDESSFDLREMIRDLDAMFRLRAEAKNVSLVVDPGSGTPHRIVTDETKLRQVLVNLLANALKFTERGSVTLSVSVVPGPKEGGELRLVAEVEDSGPGIAPAEMPSLFQAFEQTESGRRSNTGTGLGLAISRRFAELLGGSLDASSQVGKGSVFRLEIPIRAASKDSTPPRSQPRHVFGLEPGQPTIRVLVVDDEADNRAFLEALLVPVGFEVRTVEDGHRAVLEFEAWRPQLVLMDLRLPVVTGVEAIGRIREQSTTAEVKIIAVTAAAFQEDRRQALRAGADDYLSKPFREEVLFGKIQTLLGLRYVFDEGGTPAPGEASLRPGPAPREQVTALPAELVTDLRRAALAADPDRILELCDQAEPHSPEIAREVRRYASGFAYQNVLALLESGKVP